MISVVLPIQEPCKFAAESIESVLKQRIEDLELLLCVPRDSLLTTYSLPENVRVLRSSLEHPSPAEARNLGISQAKGHWITFLDADDVLVSNTLKLRLEMAEANPTIDLIIGQIRDLINAQGTPIRKYWRESSVPMAQDRFSLMQKLASREVVPALWNCFFKKTVFDKFGLLDESLRYGEDLEFILRVSNQVKVKLCSIQTIDYRIHSGNFLNHISLGTNKKMLAETWLVSKQYQLA